MGEGLLLNGVVYLHRIIDPRISGTTRSNLRLFRELCGAENLHNTVLGTTFWTGVDDAVGQKRESQILADPNFWKPMVEKGSCAFRLKESRQDYLQVLSHIALKGNKFRVQAQEEMSETKEVWETSAGRAMNLGLDQFKEQCEERLFAERRKQQAQIDGIKSRQREAQRREQEEAERQRQIQIKRLEMEWVQREKEQRESETRQMLHEKMNRERTEREMQLRLDMAARVLCEREAEARRLQQLSSYVCRHFDTKKAHCNACLRRLDSVGTGKWCYRKHADSLLKVPR